MAGHNELTRLIPPNGNAAHNSDEQRTPPNGTPVSPKLLTGSSSCCSDYIKAFVFGGSDGLMSSLTITSAIAGAGLSWRVVVIVATACTLSNCIYAGISEFLSSKAHKEFIQAEKRREQWEYKHFRESQIFEMTNRFEARGMSRRDAEVVVSKMAQYEGFFVSLMVAEDLGLQLADEHEATFLTEAFVMLLSFACFASIPILIYSLAALGVRDDSELYAAVAVTSLAVLTTLGFVKSRISSSSWVASSLEALSLGLLCAGLSYFAGFQLTGFFNGYR